MNHFRTLHRCIFDRSFLRLVGFRKGLETAGFFFAWFLTAIVVATLASSARVLFLDSTLPARIAAVAGESRIEGGVLHPDVPTPFSPPPSYTSDVFSSLMSGWPELFENNPDSLIVIDTSLVPDSVPHARIVLGRTHMYQLMGATWRNSVSYTELFGDAASLRLDAPTVRTLLREHWLSVVFSVAAWQTLVVCYKALSGLPFLFFAAYILSIGALPLPMGIALKKASYAFGVVLAGYCVEALAGSNLSEPWYVFMTASLVLIVLASWRRPAPQADNGRDSTGTGRQ